MKQTSWLLCAMFCVLTACTAENKPFEGLPQLPPKKSDPKAAPVATPQPDPIPAPTPTPEPTPVPEPKPEPTPLPYVNTGWVGGACSDASACTIGGAFCRTNGYPGGMCSLECSPTSHTCVDTDAENTTTTFCVAAGAPTAAACVSRCSFVNTDVGRGYPQTGCRDGYVCATRPRFADASAINDVCVPTLINAPPISDCRMDFARGGNDYSAWLAPQTVLEAGKTCTVEDAMTLVPEIGGIPFRYNVSTVAKLNTRCEMAAALQKLVAIAKDMGVKEIRHLGTYNCRKVAGSTTLSQHALARAIDLSGFVMNDGSLVTVSQHWERGVSAPVTTQGKFLYDLVHRLHAEHVFNVILTPEFNADHHDHFHVDLTPGSDFLSQRHLPVPYLGEFDGEE